MVTFKLDIYQASLQELVQSVLFNENNQQHAKERMCDIFREEAAKLDDGDYCAALFRPIENTGKWMRVSGSPMISCTVKSSIVTMGEKRLKYVKRTDEFIKEMLTGEVTEDVMNRIQVKVKNLHHGTDNNSRYLERWGEIKGHKAERCANIDCDNPDPNPALVGAHVIKVEGEDKAWYICPLCHKCNSDKNEDDMSVFEHDLVPYNTLK